jgi:hypothetical protein
MWFVKTSDTTMPSDPSYVPYIFAKPIPCDDPNAIPTSFQIVALHQQNNGGKIQYSLAYNLQVWQADSTTTAYVGDDSPQRFFITINATTIVIKDTKDLPTYGNITYRVVLRDLVPKDMLFAETINPPVTQSALLSTGNFMKEITKSYYFWGAVAICAVCVVVIMVKRNSED